MRQAFVAFAFIALAATPLFSQKRSHSRKKPPVLEKMSGTTATAVGAEMTQGLLSPSESKAGDQVVLRLKDDVKSNGQVVLQKGTTINGVVRKVSWLDGKTEASGAALSMLEIEWFTPAFVAGSHELLIAVQSVLQASRGTPTGIAGDRPVLESAGSALTARTKADLQLNKALMRMPTVVPADAKTAKSLESNFGVSGDQLFVTGNGEVVTAGGSKESLEIFSHMNNDTVMTSESRTFEVSSGAQLQLLIGVKKN